MRIYIDDDTAHGVLAALLRAAGHDVVVPTEVLMSGQDDPSHLTYAIRERRVFLSANHNDFRKLHKLIMQAEGHHPGIVIIRKDNDLRRDLKPHGIARAVNNMVAAGVALESSFYILNQFR